MSEKNGAANVRKIGQQMSQNMGRQMSERQVSHNPFISSIVYIVTMVLKIHLGLQIIVLMKDNWRCRVDDMESKEEEK